MSKALWATTSARVQHYVPHGTHGEQDLALCLPKLCNFAVTSSRKLTRVFSVSTRSNCCQQIDTNHQPYFSGPDLAHNRDCCYQKTRHNEDIFFQSYCTTPEDTVRLYNVRSATNAPHCSHHWMMRVGCLSPDTFSQPWPLDLCGWFSPCGTASDDGVLYLLPKLTERLV